jgi:polypeptide N-acetylgalactosaminyltransferase
MGLVKARLRGADAATAETFTVLDSHIEVQTGWLEPLMRRMKDHPTRVMMPMIDSINPETFQSRHGGIGCSLGYVTTMHLIACHSRW